MDAWTPCNTSAQPRHDSSHMLTISLWYSIQGLSSSGMTEASIGFVQWGDEPRQWAGPQEPETRWMLGLLTKWVGKGVWCGSAPGRKAHKSFVWYEKKPVLQARAQGWTLLRRGYQR